MSIKSLHLDTETFNAFEVGIAELPLESPPLRLEPLGDLVVIAGANGAGKSRLLRLVDSLARRLLSASELANLTSHLFELNNSAKSFSLELLGIDDGSVPFDSTQAKDSRRNSVANTLANIRAQIERAETTVRANKAVARSSDSTYKIIHFVPRTAQLFDPARDSDNTAMQRSNALMYSGRDSSEVNAPAYARHVLRAALLAWRESNESRQSPLHVEALEAEKSLRAILKELLGPGFHFELNSHLNLELGRKTSESFASELSEGQQVLFQLACMLHSQGSVLRDAIILMDEPENHLHPAALNDVIDKLRAIQGIGQIWIATHSVPLIAHTAAINPDCLWYAENGRFQRAGRTPMRVLHSLMGGSDGAANLQALTMLPAEYAAARFLGECLLPPGVVGPDTKDPQTNQIATIARALSSQRGRPLRVLDFGAGVGRLLSTLVTQAPDNDVLQFVDYRALEPDESKHDDLLHEIKSVYGSDIDRRIFTDEYSMKAGLDSRSVDLIVMCNVLH